MKSRSSKLLRIQRRFIVLGLTPVLIYIITFVLFPVIMALINSTFNMTTGTFVGLSNYREFLFEDPRGISTVRNTIVYALIRMPATIIPGFFIANALDKVKTYRGPLVFMYFAPYLANMVAFSSVFMYLYANTGLFNSLLTSLGLNRMTFIRGVNQALVSVALMDAWKHIGFDIVVFFAAMKSIPPQLFEAAEIDGASPIQQLFRVKLPLIAPTILFLFVVIFIWTMQVFEPVYIMTQGGPVNATSTVVFRIYNVAFQEFRMGYSSAIAFVLFGMILLVTLIQLRIGRTRWSY